MSKNQLALAHRRYSEEAKERAVRMARQLREATVETMGTVGRVAGQLGRGVESLREVPMFYGHKLSGAGRNRRDYVVGPTTPLYPFGFGLGYTTFLIETGIEAPTWEPMSRRRSSPS